VVLDRLRTDEERGRSFPGRPNLPRLLAASDVALVQGGLTTTMELVALGRPVATDGAARAAALMAELL
jgi:hypothetical protein